MLSFHPKHVRSALAAVAIVTTGLMLATPAQAADQQTQAHRTVRIVGLNPASSHDMQTLFFRLRSAAEEVCGDDGDVVEIWEYRDIDRCEQQAVESAVSQVDQPLLTALYDRHYPGAPMASNVNASLPRA
jgi:UrcA family protein